MANALTAAAVAGWEAVLRVAQNMAHRAIEGGLVVMTGLVTWRAYWWAFDYAGDALLAQQDAVGTAAVLAAILGPLTTFQGFTVVKFFEKPKGESGV